MTLKPEVTALLQMFAAQGTPPIEELSLEVARKAFETRPLM